MVKLTQVRKAQIRARWNEKEKVRSLDWWRTFFEYVRKSEFLMGKNDRNWTPNLEWLTKESKFVDVVEGKFHNK